MIAVILAGGFGTRLRGVIGDLPKPMAPINDEPFLAHTIRNLAKQGVTEIILSVHYKKEVIINYFGNNFDGVKIRYSEEKKPLDTGGALKMAFSKLRDGGPVVVMNGDTLSPIDYSDMMREYVAPIIMACTNNGKINNAGIYIIDADFFNNSITDSFSFEKEILERMYCPIYEIPWFIDIGTPEGYKKAKLKFMH